MGALKPRVPFTFHNVYEEYSDSFRLVWEAHGHDLTRLPLTSSLIHILSGERIYNAIWFFIKFLERPILGTRNSV